MRTRGGGDPLVFFARISSLSWLTPLVSAIGPAEAAWPPVLPADGPVNQPGPADDVFPRERSPSARIVAVDRVVAHDHVIVRRHGELGLFVREVLGGITEQLAVDVPRVLAVGWWPRRIERVDLFKMRIGRFQSSAVDVDVAIIADAD